MLTLDCDTFESATESVARLLATTPGALIDRVRAFDYDAINVAGQRLHPYEDLLAAHVCAARTDTLPVPDETCWFHAARVAPGTSFGEGILPLPSMLDRLWRNLRLLAAEWATDSEWERFRREMHGNGARQYATKVAFQPGGGPFAFLVRPLIFQPRLAGNHDYLGVPEIIEDICLSYSEMCGGDLRARFVQATRPCIVKFRSSEARDDVVRSALMFIHKALLREPLSIHCNTCYSGVGNAVPSGAIMRIDWPNDNVIER